MICPYCKKKEAAEKFSGKPIDILTIAKMVQKTGIGTI